MVLKCIKRRKTAMNPDTKKNLAKNIKITYQNSKFKEINIIKIRII